MDAMQTIPRLFLDFMQMREFAKDPLVFVGGEGIRLTDTAGRRYIDGLSGVFVCSLGHGNMPVIEAMAAQARQLAFAPPLHGTTPPALELTELLLRLAPEGVGAGRWWRVVRGGSGGGGSAPASRVTVGPAAGPAGVPSAPPPASARRFRGLTRRHNVVLIYDEIITGFGRLGTMFGSENFAAPPDITCCGKGMSGGYAPLAAILIRDRIADAFYGEADEHREFHHGHTYAGNPVACAAGVAAITQLIERGIVANARRQGERLRSRLNELAERFPP